jgi:uncharacterized membrane protein YhdT
MCVCSQSRAGHTVIHLSSVCLPSNCCCCCCCCKASLLNSQWFDLTCVLSILLFVSAGLAHCKVRLPRMDTDNAGTGSNRVRIQYSTDHLRAMQPQFRQPYTALRQAIGSELLAVGWGSQAYVQPDSEGKFSSSHGSTASCTPASAVKPQAYPAALPQQSAVIGTSARHTALAYQLNPNNHYSLQRLSKAT